MLDLLELVVDAVLYWRLALAVLIAIAATVLLVMLVPGFTGAYAFALIVGGALAGVLWELSAPRGR